MYVKISGVEGRLLYLQRTVADDFQLTLLFLLFLIEQRRRRYGHPADPPVENDNRIFTQPAESSPRISHVPHVLPLSTSNHAYEDIEPQQGGQTATSELQRQNSVDMPATQQPFLHPRLRSLTANKNNNNNNNNNSSNSNNNNTSFHHSIIYKK